MDKQNNTNNPNADLPQFGDATNTAPNPGNAQGGASVPASNNAVNQNIYQSLRGRAQAGSKISFAVILNYTVWIACLAICAALTLLVIVPQYNRYKEILVQTAEKQAELDKVAAQLSYLKNLEAFKDTLFVNQGIAKQAIPVQEDTPYFLDQLIQVAKEADVQIQTLVFGGFSTDDTDNTVAGDESGAPRNTGLRRFNVKIAFFSSYDQSETFLRNLERARRLSTVKSLDLLHLDDESSIKDYKEAVEAQKKLDAEAGVPPKTTSIGEEGFLPALADDKIYKTELTLEGYTMKDPDVDSLDLDTLLNQPKLDVIVDRITALKYYEPLPADLKVGRFNPFETVAAGEDKAAAKAMVKTTDATNTDVTE